MRVGRIERRKGSIEGHEDLGAQELSGTWNNCNQRALDPNEHVSIF